MQSVIHYKCVSGCRIKTHFFLFVAFFSVKLEDLYVFNMMRFRVYAVVLLALFGLLWICTRDEEFISTPLVESDFDLFFKSKKKIVVIRQAFVSTWRVRVQRTHTHCYRIPWKMYVCNKSLYKTDFQNDSIESRSDVHIIKAKVLRRI